MNTPSRSLGSILGSVFLLALASTSTAARPPKGGYFGLGIGYSIVSGDRGVPMKQPNDKGISIDVLETTDLYKEIVRTDFGEGMGLEFRFGYDFGPVAAEISLHGHGTFDFANGAGYPSLQVRFNPFSLIDSLAESKIDVNIYLGAGYAIGGYEYKEPGGTDEAGWEGWVFDFGIQGLYQLSPRIHLGLDVKFDLPMYSTWIFSSDDDIEFEPESTPSTMVITPALSLVTYF